MSRLVYLEAQDERPSEHQQSATRRRGPKEAAQDQEQPRNGGAKRAARRPISCEICGEDISEQNQTVHYGAVACFSCRAFFRRAKTLKRPLHPCKAGEHCEISVDTRRFCGSCRYQACLRAGMKPGAVLSEEQKKHRFRKMIKKRKASKGLQEKLPLAPPSRPTTSSFIYPSSSANSTGSSSPSPQANLSSSFDLNTTTLGNLESSFAELHSLHLVPAAFNLSLLGDLYRHLTDSLMRAFALSLPEFRRMKFLHRQLLLARNGRAFAQFAVCRYLSRHRSGGGGDHDGLRQLSVFFPHLQPSFSDGAELRTVSLEDLAKAVLRPALGEENLLLHAYLQELKRTVSTMKQGEVLESSLTDVGKDIALTPAVSFAASEVKVNGTQGVETLMAAKVKELSSMAAVLACTHQMKTCPPTFAEEDVASSFWACVRSRSAQVARIALYSLDDFVDDLESVFYRRSPHILSLFLVRLYVAEEASEQMALLGFPSSKVLGPKTEVFRMTTNKHLLRRALDDFVELVSQCRRCFITDDLFYLLMAMAAFWPSDSSASDHMWQRSALLATLNCTIANVPVLRESLYKEVVDCLHSLESLKALCVTFAREDVTSHLSGSLK